MNGKPFLPAESVQPAPASIIDRWASWLWRLFPLSTLFNRAAATDPVHGIALPNGEPEEDISMITAYYLSFYE